ncbi:MAG: class I SAM-dependent methyltransferase [Anaerolineaceae bacterium]|nr:class I SAM-dependent methyltransferase [Anaerolineaceae bacterium]
MSGTEVKEQVRRFYDQIGWQEVAEGLYQNARYEDLRPVAAEYIHRCHLRITPFFQAGGRFLLDVGSGPVQYPEYLTYSAPYQYRVCLDISHVALVEARRRLGEHGLYVVSDAASLPFAGDCFDGLVSLHTLHHLPLEEQEKAYREFHRVLSFGRNAVVVNGWTESDLMSFFQPLVALMERAGTWLARRRGRADAAKLQPFQEETVREKPTGTFVRKMNADWLWVSLGTEMDFEIRVWRSVSVRFLRAVIHHQLGGRLWLRLLFWLEERFPYYFGEKGQYPLIIVRKPRTMGSDGTTN